jgi:hypothetical protein
MYLFPYTVIEKVARDAQSALPDAPVVPWEPSQPRRHFPRLSVGFRRLTRSAGTEPCEAEPRDRSAKVARTAGAC